MNDSPVVCPICHENAIHQGTKKGEFIPRDFHLERCPSCQFCFVSNPCTDWDALYNDAYYRGRGADPLVNFMYEIKNPSKTIRHYEYTGIVKIVTALKPLAPNTRWLDFGCGPGGLVRHVKHSYSCDIVGFDTNPVYLETGNDPSSFIPPEQVGNLKEEFDVVTAIEVLEHVVEPVECLSLIRKLLKPGGVFFYTTGNSEKHRDHILDWSYFRPETHISLFEPQTMSKALQLAGFTPFHIGFTDGFEDIILFKILKNLGITNVHSFLKFLPVNTIARYVDRKYGVTSFPVGLVPAEVA